MNQDVAEFYDDLYGNEEKVFAGEALPFVKRIPEILPQGGTVLDLGAGTGRNALFLAEHGFAVTAVDVSRKGLERLDAKAKEKNLTITTIQSDLKDFLIEGRYDAIVCAFTLHYIERSVALGVLEAMKVHTNPGGLNAVMAFTKTGASFDADPNTPNFYLDTKEALADCYQGWEILQLTERDGRARLLDAQGNLKFNVFVAILAQKK